jgi:rare lipoprotein A
MIHAKMLRGILGRVSPLGPRQARRQSVHMEIGQDMTIDATWKLTGLTLVLAILAGCEGGAGGPGGQSGDAVAGADGPATPRARRGGSQDVDAPDVFSATDEGLWDGRPSLGGIWVASPDATTPERVRITNPETGKSVNGALFRRERDNPGPKLQLSSEAATALGMLAGAPATLTVVALRRQEPVAEEEEPAVVAEELAPQDAPTATAPDEPVAEGEAAEVAAAAVAAIGATDEVAAAAAEGTEAAASAAATAAAPRRGLFGGLFGRRNAAEGVAAAAQDGVPDGVQDAEGAPLTAIDPAAVAAAPAAPAPAAASGAAVSVVIGAFGVQANADAAVGILQKAGYTAEVTPGKLGEKPIWTVSAKGRGDKAAVLKAVQALGYKDAYLD